MKRIASFGTQDKSRTSDPFKCTGLDASTDESSPYEIGSERNGEGEIRTPVTVAGQPVFETGAFNHSATSPGELETISDPNRRVKIASAGSSDADKRPNLVWKTEREGFEPSVQVLTRTTV